MINGCTVAKAKLFQLITYVKPVINYVKDLFKLGKARRLLQNNKTTLLLRNLL